jgi:outer membrane immunogenic protein
MNDRCTTLSRLIAGAALLLMLPAGAQAADMPSAPYYKGPPIYEAPYYDWTGFYVGLNAGYGFGTSKWTNAVGVTTGDFDIDGGVAGGTVGFNIQAGSGVVWGVEGDIGWSGIKGGSTVACAGGCTTKNSWLGTARFRLGYAFDRWLPYLTGGGAYGNIKATSILGSTSSSEFGWTAGAGMEFAVAGGWTAKLEYLYVDLGDGACSGACALAPITVKFQTSLIRGGINYRF